MGRTGAPPIRALTRIFLPGADPSGPMVLPDDEVSKLRKVLRLEQGDQIAILPDDGSLVRCEFRGKEAIPLETVFPDTEPKKRVVLAQALPKADRLDTVVRMATELGVAGFWLFEAERSVVRWDAAKLGAKLRRLRSIVRESAEQCFRSRLPFVEALDGFDDVFRRDPQTIVLSEVEGPMPTLREAAESRDTMTLAVGPEGGWSPPELEKIGPRGATMGKLVLRTDTAGPAALAAVLLP